MSSRALVAVLGMSLAACAVPRVGEPAPTLVDGDAEREYREIFKRHTARDEVYGGKSVVVSRGLDTQLFAAATHQSWAFREARVRREAAFKAEPPAVVEEKLAKERAEAEQFEEFFLGVHVNEPQFDDFDRKNSIWRIALVGAEGEATPVDVKRLGKGNLEFRAYYPYMDTFWVGYRVRFPKTAAGQEGLLLRVASSLGQAQLRFPPQ